MPQWERAKSFFEGFDWTVRRHATLEADDLLGTLADLETEAGGDALLLTGDRDMFQCASKQVTVLYLQTGKRGAQPIGPKEVKARYGIGPELVPDFIALRGDPSDGIPGAKGVGEKTAAELLREHGSLEALLRERAADQAPRASHDADLDRGRDPLLPRHRDAPRREDRAAQGRTDEPQGRRPLRAPPRHEPPGRAPGKDGRGGSMSLTRANVQRSAL